MAVVVLLSIDGLRPDALAKSDSPSLQQFCKKGAFTLKASSVLPSITLPCHTSIFHSVPPARHGIMSNVWTPMARPLPGLVEVAYQAGKKCAFFYNWEQLRDLTRPGHLEYSYFRSNGEAHGLVDRHADDHIVTEAARILTSESMGFAFIYLGSVDVVGHAEGWMSDSYLEQVAHIDTLFTRLLNALPADSTVLVQSDHGGHGRSHGTASPEDMLIPWFIAGPHIRQKHEITSDISLLDTAPTLAHLLGLTAPPQWEGKIPQEIFV